MSRYLLLAMRLCCLVMLVTSVMIGLKMLSRIRFRVVPFMCIGCEFVQFGRRLSIVLGLSLALRSEHSGRR